MTDSMVERVARAMEASLGRRTNSSDMNPIIDPLHPDLRAALPVMARAAIAAMREPIHAAIDKVNPGESDYDDWWCASVKKQIDAALKEP